MQDFPEEIYLLDYVIYLDRNIHLTRKDKTKALKLLAIENG